MPREDDTDAAGQQIETFLRSRLASVEDEICHYPTPIAACDTQFNYLLEQRSRIPHEIASLHGAMSASETEPEKQKKLDAFVASCPFIDPCDGETG